MISHYLAAERGKAAENYLDSQKTHLGHFQRQLGAALDEDCQRISRRQVSLHLESRLAIRNAVTVEKERITLRKLYDWAVSEEFMAESPAAGIPRFKGGKDRPPFRTLEQIRAILERGGLSPTEALDLWECLYLNTEEIAGLLETVRIRAQEDYSYLLHAIPAYTGIRRGEILRLRWADVSFEDDSLTARSRKQSRKKQETSRTIELHRDLKRELEVWRKERPKGQYLICDRKTLEPIDPHRANRCFWQPLRHTGWCLSSSKNWFKIGFHSYRHSFASNLAAAGVDQRLVDEFMGHQSEEMRRRYRHLFPKKRREAIETLVFRPAAAEAC